ncbi:hypothetical protein UA45_17310 [Morganella morganii]|uniref:Uncharacterized protein n=1 Tax=Morganella morganii TaxID=582 RepID=A0A0D8L4M4_MORMO|nr:hypothetical protein UA45_17310 [Morganella morganii]
MKDEGPPQRNVLKVPAFMANIFIRAGHYWTALGNMAGNLSSGAEPAEKKVNYNNLPLLRSTLWRK